MASVGGDNARGAELLRATQAEVAEGIDALFDQVLAVPADPRGPLYEAMRYAAIAGGKRLRPLLVRAAGDLFQFGVPSVMGWMTRLLEDSGRA